MRACAGTHINLYRRKGGEEGYPRRQFYSVPLVAPQCLSIPPLEALVLVVFFVSHGWLCGKMQSSARGDVWAVDSSSSESIARVVLPARISGAGKEDVRV